MSYCVNCGVELGKDARVCPLCDTPVYNPKEPCPQNAEPYFPTRQEKILPVSKKALAGVLSSMFASVALCCGLLNLALRPDVLWSLYAVGAAAMLWLWTVPPLLWRKMPFLLRVFVNMCAMGFYLLLIALASGGLHWYVKLGLPILFSSGVIGIIWCCILRRHSILTTVVAALLGIGIFCGTIELFVDLFLRNFWSPGWSLVVLAVSVGFCIPLVVIRCIPSLREEARRRFHL